VWLWRSVSTTPAVAPKFPSIWTGVRVEEVGVGTASLGGGDALDIGEGEEAAA
jgi:hypothetical protein